MNVSGEKLISDFMRTDGGDRDMNVVGAVGSEAVFKIPFDEQYNEVVISSAMMVIHGSERTAANHFPGLDHALINGLGLILEYRDGYKQHLPMIVHDSRDLLNWDPDAQVVNYPSTNKDVFTLNIIQRDVVYAPKILKSINIVIQDDLAAIDFMRVYYKGAWLR